MIKTRNKRKQLKQRNLEGDSIKSKPKNKYHIEYSNQYFINQN